MIKNIIDWLFIFLGLMGIGILIYMFIEEPKYPGSQINKPNTYNKILIIVRWIVFIFIVYLVILQIFYIFEKYATSRNIKNITLKI